MYIGYHDLTTLPIQQGQTVRIPRGATVHSPTHPNPDKRCRKAGRSYNIVVHHVLSGMENGPQVENPKICWAGDGGYWCEVDINEVVKEEKS